MYSMYFSLSELPFSIAPDPRFLFMSERHREALSHLTYGLDETGGFVLLTGEVGTGKTTISRCLMEQLPENTQSAFILNPMLSSQELLATLCDQLKVSFDQEAASLKNLTDKLSAKLLDNHAQGINTLLIIDEAQHLQVEVLEQLRLLTNLETNTKKLLKVILIGQPELQQLLRRRDLRQLAQRITARYHLMPLNYNELAQYIQHRVAIAGGHRNLFNKSSIKTIHKLSQGIPRLINLLCHHALMDTYENNLAVVTKKNVLKAAQQALGESPKEENKITFAGIKTLLAASILVAVSAAGFWLNSTSQAEYQNQVELINKQVQLNAQLLENNTVEEQQAEIEAALLAEAKKQKASASKELVKEQIEKEQLEKQLLVKQLELAEQELSYVKKKYQETSVTQNINEPSVPLQVAKQENVEPSQQNVTNKTVEQENFALKEIDGIPDDLMARFKKAMQETPLEEPSVTTTSLTQSRLEQSSLDKTNTTKQFSIGNRQVTSTNAIDNSPAIRPLASMPSWVQQGIPPLAFEQHIYATDGAGWIKVNGRDRYEGDSIADGLILDEILPQKVILTYRGEKFSLPALINWQ